MQNMPAEQLFADAEVEAMAHPDIVTEKVCSVCWSRLVAIWVDQHQLSETGPSRDTSGYVEGCPVCDVDGE